MIKNYDIINIRKKLKALADKRIMNQLKKLQNELKYVFNNKKMRISDHQSENWKKMKELEVRAFFINILVCCLSHQFVS